MPVFQTSSFRASGHGGGGRVPRCVDLFTEKFQPITCPSLGFWWIYEESLVSRLDWRRRTINLRVGHLISEKIKIYRDVSAIYCSPTRDD